MLLELATKGFRMVLLHVAIEAATLCGAEPEQAKPHRLGSSIETLRMSGPDPTLDAGQFARAAAQLQWCRVK